MLNNREMYMKSLFVSTAFIFSLVSAKHIQFKDCGNKEINYIDITPCNVSPCDISIYDDYVLSIQFKANEDTATVQLVGTAKFPDGESYPLPAQDLCASSRGLCPIKNGSVVTAQLNVNIPLSIKPGNVKIDANLIGDGEKILACAEFVVNIVSSTNNAL